jgi:hypothetical protein
MSESTEISEHRCADCAWRRKAEANPRSFLARLWRFHTRFCPGWKSYQHALADAGEGRRDT